MSGPVFRGRVASTIPIETTPQMTHGEYVNWDGHRIFRGMVSRARQFVRRPEWYVLYSPLDLHRLPPCPGVYIAFCESGVCRYVGESTCVGKRVGPFLSRGELDGAKYIAFIPADNEREQYAMEFYWMGLLSPLNNKQLRARGKIALCTFGSICWNDAEGCWESNEGTSKQIDRNGRLIQHGR